MDSFEKPKKSPKCNKVLASFCAGFAFIVLVILVIFFVKYFPNDEPNLYKIVQTKDGGIRGRRFETAYRKRPYFAFRGIRYGKPPVGDLRFKAPEPVDSWAPGTIDALDFGATCMRSYGANLAIVPLSEDCLFLNAFVPDVNQTERLPVHLQIPGGAFLYVNSEKFRSDPLIEENIIYITINYRNGPFGFLSLGTREYSGNMGLKDMRLALKWVYNNVEHFGGDNSRITINGGSSGAISNLLLLLNEESRSYFRRAILMSGSLLNSYQHGNHRCIVDAFARSLSKSIRNETELMEFLKQVPAELIAKLSLLPQINAPANFLIWAPIIEVKDAIRPMFTEDPYALIKSTDLGNMSLCITQTKQETLTYILKFAPNLQQQIDEFQVYFPLHAFDVGALSGISLQTRPYMRALVNEIRSRYLVNVTTQNDKIKAMTRMTSDFIFNYFIEKTIEALLPKTSSIFNWRFSVIPTLDEDALMETNITEWMTISPYHGMDITYFTWQPEHERIVATKDTDPLSAIQIQTIAHMTALISNFVKYGTPTVNDHPVKGFEPIKIGEFNFLDIRNDGLFMGKSPNGNLKEFIDINRIKAEQLLRKHGEYLDGDLLEELCENLERF